MTTKIFELKDLPQIAKEFIESIGEDRIFLFNGEMGSGKTTFIAEVCRQLGADDDFGSPTFSIINEYRNAEGEAIYHFDLYRIEDTHELLDMGTEDYFLSGNLCFIEWPDRLSHLVPDDAREVTLSVNADGSRAIIF